MSTEGALLLAGGGHGHALLLKRWAMQPRRRPSRAVILVSRHGTTLYSGMVPGLIAGFYRQEEVTIDLRSLCDQAGVAFIQAEIRGLDPQRRQLLLHDRPPLHYGLLSLNVGAISKPTAPGVPIKPLEPALAFLVSEDHDPATPFRVVGGGAAGTEVVLALRRRWPQRPLQLQIHPDQAPLHQQQALNNADIALVQADQTPPGGVLLCTGSHAPRWLADAQLPVDADGRVHTDSCLRVEGHPDLFASGDCAVISRAPRPASGVWAVRAAAPLARNLEAACRGDALRSWRPQRQAIQLIGNPSPTSAPQAWAVRGAWRSPPSAALWRWKQQIDRRFMQGFQPTAPMASVEPMACRGCAAKLPAAPLAAALDLAGFGTLASAPEDAVNLGGQPPLLQSVDGFPALLSDPWLNGRLTALHACSDLWACGAYVRNAMAVITLPALEHALQRDLLAQTLAGIRSALAPQGAALVGGHTLEARGPSGQPASLDLQVSLSVTGEAERPWPKAGIRDGDALLLSRPLGSGVLFAAAMAGAAPPGRLDATLSVMGSSQHMLLKDLLGLGTAIHACTDITGFGLLGHLGEMLQGSPDVRLHLDATAIPAYPDALRLLDAGYASSLAPANRNAWCWLEQGVSLSGQTHQHQALLELLVDPQTCGPLLVACTATAAETLREEGPWILIGTAEARRA